MSSSQYQCQRRLLFGHCVLLVWAPLVSLPLAGQEKGRTFTLAESTRGWSIHGRRTHLGSTGCVGSTERHASYILVSAMRASEAAVRHSSLPGANKYPALAKSSCSCSHAVPMTYES